MSRGPEPFTRTEREINEIVERDFAITFQASYGVLYDLMHLMSMRLAYLRENDVPFADELTALKRIASFIPADLAARGPTKFPQINSQTNVHFNALEMDAIGESVLDTEKGHGFVPKMVPNPGKTFLGFHGSFVEGGGRMNSEIVGDLRRIVK